MQIHRFSLTIAFSILVYATVPKSPSDDVQRQVAIKQEDNIARTSANEIETQEESKGSLSSQRKQ